MRGAVQERYCAVYLPAFRIERMGYDGREPVCVVTEQHGVTRVLSLSPTAIAEGLHAGMTVTEARALLPELVAEPWDEEAESEDLGELVEAFRGLCNAIGPWRCSGIMLAAGAYTSLQGGEQAFVDAVARVCSELGHLARMAMADDPRAAWALATHGTSACGIYAPGQGQQAIANLPIAALHPPASIQEALQAVGVQHIGELAALPRAAIARRYGEQGVWLHRIARGDAAPMAQWEQPATPEIRATVPLGGPTTTLEPLLFAMPGVLAQLCERLVSREAAVARVLLRMVLETGPALLVRIRVGRPSRDRELLMRLIRTRMSDLRISSPITELGVVFEEICAERPWQQDLVDRSVEGEALPDLIARLSDTLGPQGVVALATRECWRPESASITLSPYSRPPTGAGARGKTDPVEVLDRHNPAHTGGRPTLLSDPPRPLDVRVDQQGMPTQVRLDGHWQEVLRTRGPECLSGEWWTSKPYDRTYWVVSTPAGTALWLYQEEQRWYCQGWFD